MTSQRGNLQAGFAKLLRTHRQAAGLTQEKLAERTDIPSQRTGITAQAISLLERGRRAPRVDTVKWLADALNLSADDRRDFTAAAQSASPLGALDGPSSTPSRLSRPAPALPQGPFDQRATDLARAAIVATMGGPRTTGDAAAAEFIIAGLQDDRSRAYESTFAWIQSELQQLISTTPHEADGVEDALTRAAQIVANHGLTVSELVGRQLDSERASQAVLSRSAAWLDAMDEPTAQMCRAAIRTVYWTMLTGPEPLPELHRAFQSAVLANLENLRSASVEVVSALKGALDEVTVVTPKLEWRPDLFAPSGLLRPEFAIVGFYGREQDLADLIGWAENCSPLSVRLYTGAGGMGKTRLMIEACNRLAIRGWRAGFLSQELNSSSWRLPLQATFERDDRLLIVVDYAETRTHEVQTLLQCALAHPARPAVRLILLARARGDWWTGLQRERRGVGDVLAGPATAVKLLPPLAHQPAQRQEVFDRAAAAFVDAVPGSKKPTVPPELDADYYDRVLYVLLMALAAVQGESVKSEDGLLDFALARERRFLDEGVQVLGHSDLVGRPILQCAAAATLAGRAGNLGEAAHLLSGVPLLAGQPAAVVASVAELLHRLYPGEAWLQGVLPDLLGEHLVERALLEDPDLLQLFGSG